MIIYNSLHSCLKYRVVSSQSTAYIISFTKSFDETTFSQPVMICKCFMKKKNTLNTVFLFKINEQKIKEINKIKKDNKNLKNAIDEKLFVHVLLFSPLFKWLYMDVDDRPWSHKV